MLLAVGMITIFAILSLVVITGNLLIRIVNKYAEPAPTKEGKAHPSQSIPSRHLVAIVSAVETLTEGKGIVTHIQPVDDSLKP